jgi:hypothetical protein
MNARLVTFWVRHDRTQEYFESGQKKRAQHAASLHERKLDSLLVAQRCRLEACPTLDLFDFVLSQANQVCFDRPPLAK